MLHCSGDLSDLGCLRLLGRTFASIVSRGAWVGCAGRFLDSGGVYKLAFGPKAFIVVSDPVVVRHLLKVWCAEPCCRDLA
jgi:hypothetical protein